MRRSGRLADKGTRTPVFRAFVVFHCFFATVPHERTGA